jgi:CRP/FNR family transcriptional regulator
MSSNLLTFSASTNSCGHCRVARTCLGGILDPSLRGELSRHVTHPRPIRHGEQLFRQGDKFDAVYVIRSGSLKTYLDSEDGFEQAVDFLYPGDLVGFDAILDKRHPTSAVALETTAYCAIPYERVIALGAESPSLFSELMRAAAQQMISVQQHVLLLGQKSALARVAVFLMNLSSRFAARGCSKTEFHLSMSRQEIASYLAVAVETISRLLTDLQNRKIISVERRLVKILSLPALEDVARDGSLLRMRTA